jgi:hypothetical protein
LFSSPGKTEALGEYIAERAGTQPGLRVLVISFRRVLADKMVGELRRAGCDLDFVKYQDIQKRPSFNSDLLVVQLDSLYRVERKLYDIVVLDECQSITITPQTDTNPRRSHIDPSTPRNCPWDRSWLRSRCDLITTKIPGSILGSAILIPESDPGINVTPGITLGPGVGLRLRIGLGSGNNTA